MNWRFKRAGFRWPAILLAVVALAVAGGVFFWNRSLQQSAAQLGRQTDQKRTNELLARVGNNVDRDFRPAIVFQRPFPAITKLTVKTAREADKLLRADELVLGVEIEGQARAYPINSLTGPRREVFNDTLAGQPIAATW